METAISYHESHPTISLSLPVSSQSQLTASAGKRSQAMIKVSLADHVPLFHGDALSVLTTLPDASIGAVLTDLPVRAAA